MQVNNPSFQVSNHPQTFPPDIRHQESNSQVHRLSEISSADLRRDEVAVHVEFGLHILAVEIPRLNLDAVEVAGAWVVDVLGRHDRARVEGVEADLAAALPLSHVDLRRPALHGGQPEGGPCALGRGRLEFGAEVVAAALGDVEVLLGVDRAAEVVDGDLLAAVRRRLLAADLVRREGERAAAELDVVLGHARAAIVVAAPGVEIVPVGIEVGLRVEARLGDDGPHGPDGEHVGHEQRAAEDEGCLVEPDHLGK